MAQSSIINMRLDEFYLTSIVGIASACQSVDFITAFISRTPPARRSRRRLLTTGVSTRQCVIPDDTNASEKPSATILNNIDRIFCLSDLHTDHVENVHWLQARMCRHDLSPVTDLLIVAGDISHDEQLFLETLQLLQQHCQVFFIPGNHEAWLSREDMFDSLNKLSHLDNRCRDLGVHVDPIFVEGTHPVWVLPFQSWYDGTLSFDEALCHDFRYWPWVDFLRCRWPSEFPLETMDSINARIPRGLVPHFLEHNQRMLQSVQSQLDNTHPSSPLNVITVSHFLPNRQCLPDWKDLESNRFQSAWLDHGAGGMSAKFAKVAGTALLDNQLRSLFTSSSSTSRNNRNQHLHIFGHSHRPKDFNYRGIRYIHNPLGKPRERRFHMIAPNVDLQLVWDTNSIGEVQGEQILRYWEQFGGGVEALDRRLELFQQGRHGKKKLD